MSRREIVMQEIRRAIVRGDLPPGKKLTENSLATDLGVSRPTVREAMAQLVNEGFLTQEPYRGIYVDSLSTEQMLDTAKVRMTLDLLAIDLILDDESGNRLSRLHNEFKTYERSVQSDDPLVRHEAHIEFHRQVWEIAENDLLIKYWPITEAQITLQLATDQRLASDLSRDVEVHRQLVDAIESRDDNAIRAALDAHTMGSVDALIATLQ